METVTFRPAITTRRKITLGVIFCLLALVAWIATLLLSLVVTAYRVPVSLAPGTPVHQIGDYVFAGGTWVIEGDKQAFPLQTTEIQCERAIHRCTSATAQIGFGGQLSTLLEQYEVMEWGANRVVFVDNSPLCASYIFTVDLLTKSVTGIRHVKRSTTDPNCAELEKELRLVIKSGFDVWWAQQQEATPWFGRIALAPFELFR